MEHSACVGRSSQTITIALDRQGHAFARAVPVVVYRVTHGPDKKRELKTSLERVLLGTAPGCHLQLSDGTVSAMHCELGFDDGGLRVRDLGSKNGTWVDGVRVMEASVGSGSTLTLGRTTLKVRLPGERAEVPIGRELQLEGLLGGSLAMRVLYEQLRRAAGSSANVLISGAVGVGKELAAEALVALSDRRDRPLVVVDARAVTSTLAEAELFGHEAGAFTGAVSSRPGAFERAHTGTLILDEVGELAPNVQAMLLGVLQRGSFLRVGGTSPITVDVRVIALTAHELPRLINQRQFRADLSYRLAGLELRVPTLEERREDIPLLVEHVLSRRTPKPTLPAGALEQLCSRAWPGNVRELENAVERLVLGVEPTLPTAEPEAAPSLDVPYATQRQRVLETFERRYVAHLLEASGGNVSAAARRGGLNRVHLHELINRLGLKGLK